MDLNNEPIEYVRGFTEFLGCKIDLSKKPLIPRTETEFWVKKIINCIRVKNTRSRVFHALDIFSGSGCIGIAVLSRVKNAEIFFVDNSPSCIAQIKINLKLNNINKKRYKVIKSDVFKNIDKKEKFDFIFANPPYIAEKNKHLVQKSVLDFEPHSALFAEEDGLLYIKQFLKNAKKYLNKNGQIFMEFSSEQKSQIKILTKHFGYKFCKFHKDQYGKSRWAEIG